MDDLLRGALDRMGLNVEHLYPASWMKETAGCAGQSRSQCRVSSDRFNRMEADLHNLYAALAELNQARSNYTFAIIGADDAIAAWGDCDFEIDAEARECEPRPIARGNFARAIFYMHHEYGAPIDPTLGALLIARHRADPPSNHERTRNNTIEGLQGTRNPYIDDPSLADALSFAGPLFKQLNACGNEGHETISSSIAEKIIPASERVVEPRDDFGIQGHRSGLRGSLNPAPQNFWHSHRNLNFHCLRSSHG